MLWVQQAALPLEQQVEPLAVLQEETQVPQRVDQPLEPLAVQQEEIQDPQQVEQQAVQQEEPLVETQVPQQEETLPPKPPTSVEMDSSTNPLKPVMMETSSKETDVVLHAESKTTERRVVPRVITLQYVETPSSNNKNNVMTET